MKQVFAYAFTLFLFASCQKGENAAEQSLPEQTISNINYAGNSDTSQRMDVYLPAGRTTSATKAIVVIHGGAWISGNKADMNSFIPVIKQQLPGYAIFNIGYRLATSTATAFPTQENDVKTAVSFIVGKAEEYKFNTAKLTILGASAGAHLGLLQAYKNASPQVKAMVDLFGPTDMPALYNAYASSPINQYGLQLLLSGTPTTNAALYQSSSPINYVTAQNPPTLILHGTADPIVPIAQSNALKTRLETAGVSVRMKSYVGAGHGDWDAATYADAYAQIVSFLNEKNP